MRTWLLVSVICTASCLKYHTKEQLEANLQELSAPGNPVARISSYDQSLCDQEKLAFQDNCDCTDGSLTSTCAVAKLLHFGRIGCCVDTTTTPPGMTLKYVAVNVIYSNLWHDSDYIKSQLEEDFFTLDQGIRNGSHQMYAWDKRLLFRDSTTPMALAVNVEVWDSQNLYDVFDAAFQAAYNHWYATSHRGPLNQMFRLFYSLNENAPYSHTGTRCYKGLAYVPDGIGAETRMRFDFLDGETSAGIGVYGNSTNGLLALRPNFQWGQAITLPTNDLTPNGGSVDASNIDEDAILLHFDNTDPLGVLVSHSSPPPPPPPPAPSPSPCQDEGPFRITWDGSQRSCEFWQSGGFCKDTYVIDRCPVTCGGCAP